MTQLDPLISAETFPLAPEQACALARPATEAVLTARWDIRGEAPSAVVEAALGHVIARHEVLRTAFVQDAAVWHQLVQPVADLKLDTVDLRALPIDDHGPRIDAIAREIGAAPFDTARAPLLRATLVRTAPRRAALLIAAHRAIADEPSLALLAHELAAAMSAILTGKPVTLPELALQYADYALWREACMNDASHQVDLDYWAGTLADLDPSGLAEGVASRPETDRVIAPRDTSLGSPRPARSRHTLPPRFGTRLADAAAARNAEPRALLIAAASAAVSRIARTRSIVLTTDWDNRTHDALSALIGPLSAPLVLRLTTPQRSTVAEHLAHVRDALSAASDHAACPFADVVAAAGAGESPLDVINVTLRTSDGDTVAGAGFALERGQAQPALQGRSLQITLAECASGWALGIDYDAARTGTDPVDALAQDILASLDTFMEAAETEPVMLLGTADGTPQSVQAAPPAPRATWTIAPMRMGSDTSPVLVTINQPHLYRNFALSLGGDITVVNLTVPDEASLERQRQMGYDALIDEATRLVVDTFAGRPISLMGQCVDGMAAMHLARRGEARGAEIGLVILCDAWAPFQGLERKTTLARRLGRIAHSRKRIAYYLQEVLHGRMTLHTLLMRTRPGRLLLRKLGHNVETAAGAELLIDVNEFHVEVANKVPFPGWQGEVITFASDSQRQYMLDTLFDWKGLVRSDTPIFRVAGWHEDALQHTSHAEIAEIVGARLDAILARRPV